MASQTTIRVLTMVLQGRKAILLEGGPLTFTKFVAHFSLKISLDVLHKHAKLLISVRSILTLLLTRLLFAILQLVSNTGMGNKPEFKTKRAQYKLKKGIVRNEILRTN